MVQLHSLFRKQLQFDSQRSLYDYWQSKCVGGSLPARSDISPAGFVKILPLISLVDVATKNGLNQYRYRLAGTGLCDHYRQEITGKDIFELHDVSDHELWKQVFDKLVSSKQPICGQVNPKDLHEHLTRFWMRLPLSDRSGRVNMILCYDIFTSLSTSIGRSYKLVTTA